MPYENFTPASLVLLIPIERCLDVRIRLPKKDEFLHAADPRIFVLTASQVVNSVGFFLKCSIRRSHSAIIAAETGTAAGLASRSFQSSDTNKSFSDGESF